MRLNPASTGNEFLNALLATLRTLAEDSKAPHPVDMMAVITGACETIYQFVDLLPRDVWYVSE